MLPRPRSNVLTLNKILKGLNTCYELRTEVQTLASKIKGDCNILLSVLGKYSSLFSLSADLSDRITVVTTLSITLCDEYFTHYGCKQKQCGNLHLCLDYLLDKCKETNCMYGHSVNTFHNCKILDSLNLKNVAADTMKTFLLKVITRELANKTCVHYQLLHCQDAEKCGKIHICYSFLNGGGHCRNGPTCIYNHNITDVLKSRNNCTVNPGSKVILSNETSLGHPDTHGNNFSEKSFNKNNKNNAANNINNNATADLPKKSSKNCNKKRIKNRPTKDPVNLQTNRSIKYGSESIKFKKTVFAGNFDGTIDEKFICLESIDGNCQNITSCPFLHSKSKRTFQWQFGCMEKWYNFHQYHSMHLEKMYQDVNCEEINLQALNPQRVQTQQMKLLKFFSNNKNRVNFESMTMECESTKKSYAVRQITTPSAAVCDSPFSTSFNWYFKSMEGSWELYKNNGISDQVIEIFFQEFHNSKNDMNAVFSYVSPVNGFPYEIDFLEMKQYNTFTNAVRPVRRRSVAFKVDRKEATAVSTFQLPSYWDPINTDGEYELYELLDKTTDEYKDIRHIVWTPMKVVVSIYRIQNPQLWTLYNSKQFELKKRYNTNKINTQKLFCFLENEDDFQDICANNFDWRKHSPQTSMKPYGCGAYFYHNVRDAASNFGAVGMTLLVFDVIIGYLTEGAEGMTRPPENPKTNSLYDATTNNINSPTVFVKYNKQEYYPSYVIFFE